jgi:hypothetical protein
MVLEFVWVVFGYLNTTFGISRVKCFIGARAEGKSVPLLAWTDP